MLGVTLPMHNVQAGVYAEEETRRLRHRFRLALLFAGGQTADTSCPASPIRKSSQALTSFRASSENCAMRWCSSWWISARPSQLRTSPFLRGFYFTGVQAGSGARYAACRPLPRSARSAQASGHATGMFQAMRPGAAAQPAQQPQYTGSKRVPQWVFVSRLFNQVILQDRAALAASGSSTKTSGLQRMLLIGASLLLFFTAIGVHRIFLQESRDGEQCRRSGRGNSRRRRRPETRSGVARFTAEARDTASGTGAGDRISSRWPSVQHGLAACSRVTICIRIFARPITIASVSCCSRKRRARLRTHLQKLAGCACIDGRLRAALSRS